VKRLHRDTLIVRHMSWNLYYHAHQLITDATSVERRESLTAHAQYGARLRARWNLEPGFAYKRRNLYVAAQHRLAECNRHIADKIVSLALEERVLLDVYDDD
jgi:hypothetical protein